MSTQRPHGPVTFDELTAGLIWPKLFRAFSMSLHPKRWAVGVLCAVVILFTARLIDPLLGGPIADFDSAVNFEGCISYNGYLPLGGYFFGLTNHYWDNALVGVARHWYLAIPVAAVLLSLFGLFSGTIARSAAVDVAANLSLSTRDCVRFAVSRWKALVFSIIIPIFLIAMLCGVLMQLVWLVGIWKDGPIVQVVLSAPAMLVSLVLVLLVLGTIAGHAMLAPAVAAECTDAADAVQRVYAYLLGRPGRFLLYAMLVISIAVLADAAFVFIVNLTMGWLEFLTNSQSIRSAWSPVLEMIYWGWLISYYSCAGTLLYLLMRRVNDQQDIREIWLPGMIPGTQAPIIPPKSGTSVELDDE